MLNSKKILTAICAVGIIALGCAKELPKHRTYPGMPPYRERPPFEDNITWRVSDYLENMLPNPKSAKTGLKPVIPTDGEVSHLETYLCFSGKAAKLGIGKIEKIGEYTRGRTHKIRQKLLMPKDMSITDMGTMPHYLKDGKITVVEWDYGFDNKTEFRVIIQEKYVPEQHKIMSVQELDIGADGTIEERLTFPMEDNPETRPIIYEKNYD